jgi:hypothetical protein
MKSDHLASITPPGAPQIEATQSEYCGHPAERKHWPEIDNQPHSSGLAQGNRTTGLAAAEQNRRSWLSIGIPNNFGGL